MKVLITVGVLIVLFAGAQCCPPPEKEAKIQKLFEDCSEKVGTTDEDIRKLRGGEYKDSAEENVMCLAKCAMEGIGAMVDGVVNDEVLASKFGGWMDDETAKQMFDTCKEEAGETICETAFKIFTCLKRNQLMFRNKE